LIKLNRAILDLLDCKLGLSKSRTSSGERWLSCALFILSIEDLFLVLEWDEFICGAAS
jgi:hypothetical protein